MPHTHLRPLAGALAIVASAGPVAAEARAARCPAANRAPAAQTREQAATATVCLLNRERAARGLARLREHPMLAGAGRRYAREMVRDGFFSHTSPDGTSMVDRLATAGYARADLAWTVGETLAWGWGTRATPAATVDSWLASPPHRRILLGAAYRDVGIGVATGIPVDDRDGATYAAELGVRS
jgi:uncharacterized protein YkwD